MIFASMKVYTPPAGEGGSQAESQLFAISCVYNCYLTALAW